MAADDRLLLAILTAPNIAAAAKAAGVARKTVYRRLDDPEFRAALEEARRSLRTQTVTELARLRAAELAQVALA
jgi:hypothetical protein